MEEYIEDLLEEHDSTIEFLDALDIDSDFAEDEWPEYFQDDDYLYNQ